MTALIRRIGSKANLTPTGDVDGMIELLSNTLEKVRSGQVKGVAIVTAKTDDTVGTLWNAKMCANTLSVGITRLFFEFNSVVGDP
jgi:hypothetical protein